MSAGGAAVTLTFGSLFSGIGGIDLGLERAGMQCKWQVELDDYCLKVLAKHWPDVPRYGDIKELDPHDLAPVDLICGGFPCQPVSIAGKRLAQADERWLWPEFFRIVRTLRPRYVLVENVPGLLSAGMGDVLGDLAADGYDAEWDCILAAAVGASHLRCRVFVVAYPTGCYVSEQVSPQSIIRERRAESRGGGSNESRPGWWLPEPPLDRMADGVPCGVVRAPLKALGNAVVPQVAEWIGRRIVDAAS